MFGGLMTVAAVCVALAISGWQPPDISTYQDYPDAPLISYDKEQLEWYYHLMKDEMAEWFLFVDDQKLIDFDSPDIYTCRCSEDYKDRYLPSPMDPNGRNLPERYLHSYQGLRGSGIDLHRLTLLIDRDQAKVIFTHLKNLITQNDGSAVIIPQEKTPRWATLTMDGKMLLLSIAIQIAILASKRYIEKKSEKSEEPQALTMAELDKIENDIDGLLYQPAYLEGKCTDYQLDTAKNDLWTNKPEKPVELKGEDMFSWSSQDGFSSNWYNINSLEDDMLTSCTYPGEEDWVSFAKI